MYKRKKHIIISLITAIILSINFNIYAQYGHESDTENIDATQQEVENENNLSQESDDLSTIDEENNKDKEQDEIDTTDLSIENELNETSDESNDETTTPEKDKEPVIESNDSSENKDEEDSNKNESKDKFEVEDDDFVSVNDWDSFKKAYENENISKIILKNNIQSGQEAVGLSVRENSIEIDGDGHRIDSNREAGSFFVLGTNQETPTLNLSNITFAHNTDYLINTQEKKNKSWHITFDNVSIEDSGYLKHVIFGTGASNVHILNNFNAKSNEGVFATDFTHYMIEDADLILNEGISADKIEVKNSSITMAGASGGLFANSGIHITNSTVNLSSENYSINVNHNDSLGDQNGLKIDGDSTVSVEMISKDFGVAIEAPKVDIQAKNLTIKSNNIGIKTKKLIIADTNLDLNTNKSTISSSEVLMKDVKGSLVSQEEVIKATSPNDKIDIEFDHSQLDLESLAQGAFSTIDVGHPHNSAASMLEAKNTSVINVYSRTKVLKNGAIRFRDSNTIEQRPTSIFVTSGSQLNIESQSMHAIYSETKTNLSINAMYQGSILNIIQKTNQNAKAAAIWYNGDNKQLIQASQGAKIQLESQKGNAPTILLSGDGGQLLSSGNESKIIINNLGEGNAPNPGTLGKNQGVYSENDGEIYIIADNDIVINTPHGAALEGSGKIIIFLDEMATFIAKGATASSTEALINAHEFEFFNYNGAYLNIENTRPGGGKAINASSKQSSFTNIEGNLSLWKTGENTSGMPNKTWKTMDYTLIGPQLETIDSTTNDDFNTDDSSYGSQGITPYSRISSGTGNAVVNILPQPFDTDRYIYGHVSIKEGEYGFRDAWNDEVLVDINHYNHKGKLVAEYKQIPTKGQSHSNPGYPVYDTISTERGGYFRIDLGEGVLATIDDQFEVVAAYQPEKEYFLEDLPEKVHVKDATPPPIAKINNVLYPDTETFSGTSEEKHVFVSLKADGVPIKDLNGNILRKEIEDGNWTFDLKEVEKLKPGQKIHVVLEDLVGNKNPLKDTPFHDIIKYEATHTTVKESQFVLTAENRYYSLKDFNAIKSNEDLIKAMDANAKEIKETEIEREVIITENQNLDFEKPLAGSYDITFVIKNFEHITLTKTLYLLDYDTVVEGPQFVIMANNFYANRHAHAASNEEIISLAQAKAINKEHPEKIVDILLVENTIQKEAKKYPLTFQVASDRDTETTIHAEVLDYDHVEESREYVIAANDFTIMEYLAHNIKDQTILEKSDAKAWKIQGFIPVPVSVKSHEILPEVGKYRATIIVQ